MGLMQKDANAADLDRGARSPKIKGKKIVPDVIVPTEAEAQEETLWECAIANNIDALRDLADKALADRQAGRTKKITL